MKFKNIKKKGSAKQNDRDKKVQKSKTLFVKPKTALKPGQKKESPRIYRFITELHLFRLKWQSTAFWLQVVSVVSLFGFLIVCGSIYDYTQVYKRVQQERVAVKQRLADWDNINAQHPGYRDGLLQEAMLLYQIGNYEKAKVYTQAALNIDPNFIPSLRLAAYLGMTQKEKIEN